MFAAYKLDSIRCVCVCATLRLIKNVSGSIKLDQKAARTAATRGRCEAQQHLSVTNLHLKNIKIKTNVSL